MNTRMEEHKTIQIKDTAFSLVEYSIARGHGVNFQSQMIREATEIDKWPHTMTTRDYGL